MQVSKWGNSLAVRLPAALVEELGLKAGDKIEITADRRDSLAVRKAPDVEELLARVRRLRGRMPAGYKFDRDEANAR